MVKHTDYYYMEKIKKILYMTWYHQWKFKWNISLNDHKVEIFNKDVACFVSKDWKEMYEYVYNLFCKK